MNESASIDTAQAEYQPSGVGRYSTRTQPPQKEITVTAPAMAVKQWDAAARAYGFDSRSALIREACAEHIRRLAKRAERPAAAGDLDKSA